MERIDLSKDVYILKNFLSLKECDELLIYSEEMGFEEASVSMPEGPQMIKGIRNNQRLIITSNDLADSLWAKLKPEVHEVFDDWKPHGLNERFRFYKYLKDQRFNKHRDGRFKRDEYTESRQTFMIYLNHDFEGGETEFDHFSVTPETGLALVFKHELKHKGCKVTRGIKYALRSDIMYRCDTH